MRFFKAFSYFFRMLFSREFFESVDKAASGRLCDPAVVFSILQRDGRFVDFLMDDLAGVPDARVGAVARTVHDGCRKTLKDYASFRPVMAEEENSRVTVESGFDPNAIRLSGSVSGDPPFKGVLVHHGWLLAESKFPVSLAGGAAVVPAEVEVE